LVDQLGLLVGLPDIVADGAGLMIRYLVPLPVDQSLDDLSRIAQVAGIVIFAAAGGHVLACASLKSFVHDELTDRLAKELCRVIGLRQDEPEPIPDGADDPAMPVDREPGEEEEEEEEEGKSPKATDPAATDSFSFSDLEVRPVISGITLEAASENREPFDPGSRILPDRRLPDDEYPDNAPDVWQP